MFNKIKLVLIEIISEAVKLGIKKYTKSACINFEFYNKCDSSDKNVGRIIF